MDNQLKQIANRITELRDIFGFSVKDMADKLEISEETYSEYENSGENIPINVLYRVSGIFGVDLTELLSGNSPKLNTISLVKKGEGLAVDRYKGYHYENIGYKFMHRKMEPMIVTLTLDEETPMPVTHSGQEINYCIEGEMIVDYDGKEIHLSAGDCVYFDPTFPHGQRAINAPAKFLTIIHE